MRYTNTRLLLLYCPLLQTTEFVGKQEATLTAVKCCNHTPNEPCYQQVEMVELC